MKRIAILGSTGSIGTQALDVIEKNPDQFSAEILTANENADLLIKQSKQFLPDAVVIANEDKYSYVKDSLSGYPVKVYTGYSSLSQIVQCESIDMVLTALVGYSGLLPTIKAIESGRNIALANKETLVIAGGLINELVKKHRTAIIPVDSEHSAIFQCMTGESFDTIEKIYLTASGGPFRGKNLEFLSDVTPAEALNHPNWSMGAKVTIDSSTLMNKGFEAIEAKWLFGLQPSQIDIVIHPQSIIHSMVQFRDGSIKAQMGLPDMRLPIQYALSYPDRLKTDFPRLGFGKYPELTFEEPDLKVFRNLKFAFDAMEAGGNMACILNAANEIVVAAFLSERISFLKMSDIIEEAMMKMKFISSPQLGDYVETDRQTREFANNLI